jgi:hypothetical protein
MPLDKKFDGVFQAIRRAVEAVGADLTGVEKDPDTGDFLEKTGDSIEEADVVLAVITDRNAEVLKKIGDAKRSEKIILPVIQRRPEATPLGEAWRYEVPLILGNIKVLRYREESLAKFEKRLVAWLRKKIARARKSPFVVKIAGKSIHECPAPPGRWQHVEARGDLCRREVEFEATLRNRSDRLLLPPFSGYLYCNEECNLAPHSFFTGFGFHTGAPALETAAEECFGLNSYYPLQIPIQFLHPYARERFRVLVTCATNEPEIKGSFVIRISNEKRNFHFPYVLKIRRQASGPVSPNNSAIWHNGAWFSR